MLYAPAISFCFYFVDADATCLCFHQLLFATSFCMVPPPLLTPSCYAQFPSLFRLTQHHLQLLNQKILIDLDEFLTLKYMISCHDSCEFFLKCFAIRYVHAIMKLRFIKSPNIIWSQSRFYLVRNSVFKNIYWPLLFCVLFSCVCCGISDANDVKITPTLWWLSWKLALWF